MAETTNSHVDNNSKNAMVWYNQFIFTTKQNPNSSDIVIDPGPPCRKILYLKIGNSRLVVNLYFMTYTTFDELTSLTCYVTWFFLLRILHFTIQILSGKV